jgi:hypothetical protein
LATERQAGVFPRDSPSDCPKPDQTHAKQPEGKCFGS